VQPVAKQLAAQADIAIVAVGFDAQSEGEGADREFALPPGQDELIREIAAVNPNTVVVVTAGGAVDVRGWIDNVPALLAVWYPGQQGGEALADLLAGSASPSGRLPISWERAPEDNPTHDNYYYNDAAHPDRIVYREGIFVGYRGYQHAGRKPLFPFGFGLSYTTFAYSNLMVQRSEDSLYTVSFNVTNTGARAGTDVAQVYVGEVRPRVARPVRELKGFARTDLKPGETRRVTIPLEARSLAYYDVASRAWRADPGGYRIDLGQSADNIAGSAVVYLPRKLLIKEKK
jgi:beta-glucosidase